MLFAELDNKRNAPGYLEKPLVKNFRELATRGPAEVGGAGHTLRSTPETSSLHS
jgi:hypothetical protein